jgi:hypothetical protein
MPEPERNGRVEGFIRTQKEAVGVGTGMLQGRGTKEAHSATTFEEMHQTVRTRQTSAWRLRGAAHYDAERQSWFRKAALFACSHLLIVLFSSGTLLVPCFWQPRIQAGDLSSHLYNAWLATLIKQGHAPGLWIARQWTNISFDIALTWLLREWGGRVGEQVAVAATVLIFFWGAFALICTVNGRSAWFVAPCLSMLAYGWVFHMGFFNFYLSAGLSCFVLAVAWGGTVRDQIIALPVLLLAWLAHPLPVLWVLVVATYVLIARQLSPRFQKRLFLVSIGILLVVSPLVLHRYEAVWHWQQLLFLTGADQLWLFGRQYWFVTFIVLFLSSVLLLRRGPDSGHSILGIPAQLYLLSAVGLALLPGDFRLPQYNVALTYVAERMSLFSGVLACIIVGGARLQRWRRFVFLVPAALYFFFLFLDVHAITRIENSVESLVSNLLPGQRVLALLPWPGVRYADAHAVIRIENNVENLASELPGMWRILNFLNSQPPSRIGLKHVIDRVCIERCLSYANYEPSTAMFRIRVLPGSPVVASDPWDSQAMQDGIYVVRQSDLPLYQIYLCGRRTTDLCIRALKAGEVNGRAP